MKKEISKKVLENKEIIKTLKIYNLTNDDLGIFLFNDTDANNAYLTSLDDSKCDVNTKYPVTVWYSISKNNIYGLFIDFTHEKIVKHLKEKNNSIYEKRGIRFV